jgi:hypothetical protein
VLWLLPVTVLLLDRQGAAHANWQRQMLPAMMLLSVLWSLTLFNPWLPQN